MRIIASYLFHALIKPVYFRSFWVPCIRLPYKKKRKTADISDRLYG